jgi:hypothetical protein
MNDDVTMVTTLHHYYGYYSGQATPGDLRHSGITIGRENVEERLEKLIAKRPDTFNINDSVVMDFDREHQARMLHEFLGRFFPQPSSFER